MKYIATGLVAIIIWCIGFYIGHTRAVFIILRPEPPALVVRGGLVEFQDGESIFGLGNTVCFSKIDTDLLWHAAKSSKEGK